LWVSNQSLMEGSAAQAGFYYQNNIAALKLIESLFYDSDINYIELENFDHGQHIDDIIIYRKSGIEYNQVKWSYDEENSYTVHNLLTPAKGKKSIFRQLAEGYKSINTSSIPVTINLITTKKISNQRRPSENLNMGLSDLLGMMAAIKTTEKDYLSISKEIGFDAEMEIIRAECKMQPEEFNNFLSVLNFHASQDPTHKVKQSALTRFSRLGIEDYYYEKLLDGVVQWSISAEKITKDLLLGFLGLNDRFEDQLSHYFKIVDERFYVPNTDLLSQLDQAIKELPGGYIFIEGLPGIGKSTALTKFKESHPEITLAYYCFIPDAANDFGELRHKSHYFLKSMTIAIERSFPELELPMRYSNRYEEKLTRYIEKLGQLQRKVIFIIDGLDHVHRDIGFGDSSMLTQLKGNLPDQVYFVMSSQYKAVLSNYVQNEIENDSRRYIKVPPFSQKEIRRYLKNKGLHLSEELIEKAEVITAGIPLYLHYVSELLCSSARRDYENVLAEFPVLNSGEINAYHNYLFENLDQEELSKWVLAILAYRKENTNAETICKILKIIGLDHNILAIQGILNRFTYLLRLNDGNEFTIFHNSFREFIISRTKDQQDNLNRALVQYYKENPESDDAYRNFFRHLYGIKQYATILEMATLEWIKKAWSDFRSPKEIKENINIALKAAIELCNVDHFIRLCFLKAQLEIIIWNLNTSGIDFPITYLKANFIKNSIRSVWDGDFVLTDTRYFSWYLTEFYKTTGNLLPKNVIKQGMSKRTGLDNSNDYAELYKALSLTKPDIRKLFQKIDDSKWVEKDDRNHTYTRSSFNVKQNARTNFIIKQKVLDFLVEAKKFKELRTLLSSSSGKREQNAIRISLIRILLPTDLSSAKSLARELDLKKLKISRIKSLILLFIDHCTDDQIREIFPIELDIPPLYEKLIAKDSFQQNIQEDIIGFFDELILCKVLHPDKCKHLSLKLAGIPQPAIGIYRTLFEIADLWEQNRKGILSPVVKLQKLQSALTHLYIKWPNEFRLAARGLFDSDYEKTFIGSDIYKIYRVFFRFASKILDAERMTELLEFFFEKESGDDGFLHYKIPLTISKVISLKYPDISKDLNLRLVRHAEDIIRQDEETLPLLSQLGELCQAYGKAGFHEEFKRLYNELIEIAFGVGNRKDYQASLITTPLELMHKASPESTLERLASVFEVQHRLKYAGNGRMQHICVSDLVTFTIQRFPALALQLITTEDNQIDRAETLDRTLPKVIANCNTQELYLYYSIVRTIPRWENRASYDQFYLSGLEYILERACELQEKAIIDEVIDDAMFYGMVENEDPKVNERIIDKLKNYDIPIPVRLMESVEGTPAKTVNESPDSATEAENDHKSLLSLFNTDYAAFKTAMETKMANRYRSDMVRAFRNQYDTWKPVMENYYKITNKSSFSDNSWLYAALRHLITIRNNYIQQNFDTFAVPNLNILIDSFCKKLDEALSNSSFSDYINTSFDRDKWVTESLFHFEFDHRSISSHLIPEEVQIQIVKDASILEYEQLLEFADKYATDSARVSAIRNIAARLLTLEPAKAKELLFDLSGDEHDFGLLTDAETGTLPSNELLTLLKTDSVYGKKIILQSYLAQKGNYSYSLISDIGQLILYKDYFEGLNPVEAYFKANLEYNTELSKGLQFKPKLYDTIRNHKEPKNFLLPVLKYMTGLLQYPVVKLRHATSQAIYQLIVRNPQEILQELFSMQKVFSDNQQEYFLVILTALSVEMPEEIAVYKNDFITLSKKEHFNIRQQVKYLLTYLDTRIPGFLSFHDKQLVRLIGRPSSLILNEPVKILQQGKKFIYSRHHSFLLAELSESVMSRYNFYDEIYTAMLNTGFPDYNSDNESTIHHNHNINSNFSHIEINSPYVDQMHAQINKLCSEKINLGCLDTDYMEEFGNHFRKEDPTTLINRPKIRPDYINWIPESITPTDFMNYNDFSLLMHRFYNRESDYITLFESGCQRPGKKRSESKFATYFTTYCYFTRDVSDLPNGQWQRYEPAVPSINMYAAELPEENQLFLNFPDPTIQPVLQLSNNLYRGQYYDTTAMMLHDIQNMMQISNLSLYDVLAGKSNVLKAFFWQNSYCDGFRRFKPTSQGFTLKIKRDYLDFFLRENNMRLEYNVKLKRSLDKYIEYEDDGWKRFERNFKPTI